MKMGHRFVQLDCPYDVLASLQGPISTSRWFWNNRCFLDRSWPNRSWRKSVLQKSSLKKLVLQKPNYEKIGFGKTMWITWNPWIPCLETMDSMESMKSMDYIMVTMESMESSERDDFGKPILENSNDSATGKLSATIVQPPHTQQQNFCQPQDLGLDKIRCWKKEVSETQI